VLHHVNYPQLSDYQLANHAQIKRPNRLLLYISPFKRCSLWYCWSLFFETIF